MAKQFNVLSAQGPTLSECQTQINGMIAFDRDQIRRSKGTQFHVGDPSIAVRGEDIFLAVTCSWEDDTHEFTET